MVRENTNRFIAILRIALRWAGRLFAVIVIVVIGLVIADSLHKRRCRGAVSHKGESYEFMGSA
jgi:hypothetical protein